MNDKIQKANGVLLGVFVTCGLGLTAATMRKATADSSGGSSTNNVCRPTINDEDCTGTVITQVTTSVGNACETINNTDCCLYKHYKVDCTKATGSSSSNGAINIVATTHSYFTLISSNPNKNCSANACVAPTPSGSSSGGSSSGGSSSGGSSSGGSSHASNSGYYFQA